MKAVLFFKILVGIMSTLMIAGFVVVFVKLADNNAQRKSKTHTPVSVLETKSEMSKNIVLDGIKTVSISAMSTDETIIATQPCGENICIVTAGNPKGHKLIMLNPNLPTDMILQRIIFLHE